MSNYNPQPGMQPGFTQQPQGMPPAQPNWQAAAGHPPFGVTPPPPPKKSKRGWIIAGSALAAVALVSAASANGAARTATPAPTATSAPTSEWDAPGDEPTVTPEPEPSETTTDPETYTPTKDDVALSIKQTSKKCYGYGIGCNVGIKVRGSVDFAATPDEGTLTVYYTIKGDEDGPIEDTMDFDLAEGTYYPNTEIIGTRSKNSKITVKVTDVEYSEY